MKSKRKVFSFDLEITARCNNNCRHCYINLPAHDRTAGDRELSPTEINRVIEEAVELGAVWCLITGGEPLLRPDFKEIYLTIKRKGLLVSLFTNACLVTKEHAVLFRKYPPRDIEVSVYGATRKTYEAVTRRPGSYDAFKKGLDLLLDSGVKVRLKAMALRSNIHEMPEIERFCRDQTKDYFRFDPFLHLRFDGDHHRNDEIKSERLSPEEIILLEQSDPERFRTLEHKCDRLIKYPTLPVDKCLACTKKTDCESYSALSRLFGCGAGNGNFTVGWDGTFRLCSSLWAPGTTCDLRTGSLRDAYENLIPRVRALRTESKTLLKACKSCPLINLCMWCPAHAYLETGTMDTPVDYFCKLANARFAAANTETTINP